MGIKRSLTDKGPPSLQDIADMSYTDGHAALLRYYKFEHKSKGSFRNYKRKYS